MSNRFFDIKNKLNGMEKKKFKRLRREGEELHKISADFDRERNVLLRNLEPYSEEFNELKQKKEDLKKEIYEKIRKLKEERKKVNEDFLNNVRWIKKERKQRILNDDALKKNKVLKEKAWKRCHDVWREFNDYYSKLIKKYKQDA